MTATLVEQASPDRVRHRARLTAPVIATVIFLTAIAPLATDMYVPAFPGVAADLSATATQVQLPLTTFFVGMALGQLVGGPVSDQYGRRRLLVVSAVLMSVASIGCALTPSIGVMMAARFVQGFSGGWAMVIGRAVIVDLARGAQLVRVLNVISGVGGIAPIVGPLLGAVILQRSHWRMSFWAVAVLGVVMVLAVLVTAPESLPPGLVVTGCGLEPHDVRLVAVTDVEPYLVAVKEYLLAHYDAATPRSDPP
jgi:DHA1 family bicyclomycin/chloramphenicol resistance-like MFS transporter